MDDIEERIKEFSQSEMERVSVGSNTEDVNENVDFVDIYQQDVRKTRDERKKTRPRGSSVIVMAVTKGVIDGDGAPGAGLLTLTRERRATVSS